MIFVLLLALAGLTLSGVAIYYSVIGLTAIFAAAFWPIVIMGTTLEVSKLVAASWLKARWEVIPGFMKTYMLTAVIVLMLITSMGIFGFLSKAHIEQTSAGEESVAKVEQLVTEIARQEAIRTRAEDQIKKLETTGSGSDAQVQAQIDKEQQRIDSAYSRIQPAIDEQQRIIDSQGTLYKDELKRVDEQLSTLQSYIDSGEIKKAQAMIGVRQDGTWGSRTTAAADEWRKGRQQARTDLLAKIENATNNPQARAAANEIKRLRQTVETQIAESNKLINRLRTQVGKNDNAADIQKNIDEQSVRIKEANIEIDKLTEEKYTLQAEYRKLEAEVGPIKYIAEFIYGEQADQNLLEKAVTWVIITIIFVFDPLAVLMLLASQMTYAWYTENKNENNRTEDSENTEEGTETPSEPQDEEGGQGQDETDSTVDPVEESIEPQYEADDGPLTDEQIEQIEESVEETTPVDAIEKDIGTLIEDSKKKDEVKGKDWTPTRNKFFWKDEYDEVVLKKKPQLESDTKKKLTKEEYAKLDRERNSQWSNAKKQWKQDHPNLTIKSFKDKYFNNEIDELPWESYMTPDTDKSGYIQNEEQTNDSSLWKKVRPE